MNTDRLKCARGKTGVHLRRWTVLLYLSVFSLGIPSGIDTQPRASAHGLRQEDRLKDPQIIREGSRLFAPLCGNAYCHGTGGVGGGAPRLRGKGLDAAYLFKSISNGIPGTAMVSFKSELSEAQIWKLVALIRSDAKTDGATSETPDSDRLAPAPSSVPAKSATPLPASTLVGDLQAGRRLFFDSGQPKSCHACHSFSGEGTPIGPDLSKLGTRSAKEIFMSIVMNREN